jgi:SAM-dependent methyltransferase
VAADPARPAAAALAGSPRQPTPDLDRLEARFRSSSPIFREAVSRQREALGEGWAAAFDETIARLLPGDDDLALAVAGYARFALDVLRLQARFDETGRYEPKAYVDVEREVYADATYMETCYLPGLLLSHYLWPHHHREAEFFEEVFVAEMIRSGADAFYDVGVGTGFYSRLALVAAQGTRGHGFDISPSSSAFAKRHAAAFGAGDRYDVEVRDVVSDPPPPVQWLISVEVIEHLEDPVAFLTALRGILAPGGKAFIGTALNAPNADHVYLYRTTDEVTAHLRAAGFIIEEEFSATAGPPARAGGTAPEVAAFIVT